MLIGHCSCLLCLDDVLLDEIMSKDFFVIVEVPKTDVIAAVVVNELKHTVAKIFVAVVNGMSNQESITCSGIWVGQV